jgi:O-acetyl-ADP-ribose deacetylase (regulator of RNase III)
MGKGIATQFKRKYGGVVELKAQHVGVGGVATLERNGAWIYYLVTKPHYSDKPTYKTLRCALNSMAVHMKAHGVIRLSMPRIGCGLDGLRWSNTKNGSGGVNGVREIINEVFAGTGVRITVYQWN